MYNLVVKDFKLGINPMFLVLPFLTGALMLIPGWIYFIVPLYLCWITMPNVFGEFKAQNDLTFSAMMPVARRDMVKARIIVIVILELLHIIIAMMFGWFTLHLYPNLTYYFFSPHMGFWGLCFVMFGIFNLVLFPLYYKTAYKYGVAMIASITAAMLFTGVAQWVGIQNSFVTDIFNGSGADRLGLQLSILVAGIAIFIVCTIISYRIALPRFLKVEIV